MGLFLAFGGWVIGFFLSLRSMWITESAVTHTGTIVTNSHYIEQLEAQFEDNYKPGELEIQVEQAGKQIEALSGQSKWLWVPAILPVLLFGLSAATFASGVLSPLTGANAATCAAVKSHITTQATGPQR